MHDSSSLRINKAHTPHFFPVFWGEREREREREKLMCVFIVMSCEIPFLRERERER